MGMFAREIEAKLDHLIYCNCQLLEILNTITDRKLYPQLMRHDMLHQIALDIQQIEEDRTLPMPLHHLRAEEIAQIATLDTTLHQGRILVSLAIPLTERSSYELYKLHPIGIPQKAHNQSLGVAYVAPTYPYLAIRRDLQTYLKMDDDHLQSCMPTHYGRVCAAQGRCPW